MALHHHTRRVFEKFAEELREIDTFLSEREVDPHFSPFTRATIGTVRATNRGIRLGVARVIAILKEYARKRHHDPD